MRTVARVFLSVGIAMLASLCLADDHSPRPSPAPDGKTTVCRASSLKGYFIYAQDGFTVAGSDAASRTPFAQAGREYYDGSGVVSGIFTASLNGKITRGRYTGTYAIAADCGGTVTFTDTAGVTYHYDLFLSEGGDEFTFIQTDNGVVSAAYERRRTDTQR